MKRQLKNMILVLVFFTVLTAGIGIAAELLGETFEHVAVLYLLAAYALYFIEDIRK